jgi:hypothetical protein
MESSKIRSETRPAAAFARCFVGMLANNVRNECAGAVEALLKEIPIETRHIQKSLDELSIGRQAREIVDMRITAYQIAAVRELRAHNVYGACK